MFGSKTILIADGSIYAALDLSDAVEASEGCVAGPVETLSEPLTILDSRDLAGAIVDCELPDAPRWSCGSPRRVCRWWCRRASHCRLHLTLSIASFRC